MKLTSRLLFTLSIFVLVGCLNNKSSNESVPTDTIAQTPDLFADSVATAKKAEAEKEAAIEKENIQRKLDDAGVLIYNYTRSLAKQIDELTHQKEDYSIDTAKISYNKYTKLVTIPFTASWLGAVYYTTGENPLKLHELKADLLLYADGTYKIKPTWLNEDLATDIKETNSMLDGLEKLNKIGEAFSDHSSNPETN